MDEIRFDEHGLVACVMQDASTGEVLTLAYVNADALERTRATGAMHFWSRSRGELWRKGETSGNAMRLRALRYDCDADALVALVDATGPACHTGQRSCFYRGDLDLQVAEALPALERTIAQRKAAIASDKAAAASGEAAAASGEADSSYTAQLLADPPLIGAKVREEAEEVARAAAQESDQRVAEEAADVLYHLTVLLGARGLVLDDALAVLNARRR